MGLRIRIKSVQIYATDATLPTLRYRRYATDATLPTLRYPRYATHATLPMLRYRRYATDATLPTLRYQRYATGTTMTGATTLLALTALLRYQRYYATGATSLPVLLRSFSCLTH